MKFMSMLGPEATTIIAAGLFFTVGAVVLASGDAERKVSGPFQGDVVIRATR